MLLVRVKSRLLVKQSRTVVRIKKREYSIPAVRENEDAIPEYPPITDESYQGRYWRNREIWVNDVKNTRTVEEKMIKVNMARYYGYRTVVLDESKIPYNAVDQMQYLTKTHVPNEPGLPSYYNDIIEPEKLRNIVSKIRGPIEDGLIFEHTSRKRSAELDETILEEPELMDNIIGKAVSVQIHRTLASNLALENPHLLESEIDYDPRIEAFWVTGGLPVPEAVKIWRRQSGLPDYIIDHPVDRHMQYVGRPNFQLRHSLPLPQIIPLSESENPDFNVPVFKYDPRVLGLTTVRRHGTNIPGFWPGDKSEFGLFSYHKCGHLAVRRFDDIPDALRVQAVLGSWGWLLAQACNLGFSTWNEVTYPLTNQMIITNGKWWTFCVYQLNTTLIHGFHIDENPRRNVCWITEPKRLYDKIENDRVYGLNDEILETLVKFYVNKPRERVGVEMKPCLQGGEGLVANIAGNMKRAWLEERFKLLVSNRPRHRPLPEVYNWQEIYMRKNQTRPMEKKREPWQVGINQWQRRLDDHVKRFIPRAVRVIKKNTKWIQKYYP